MNGFGLLILLPFLAVCTGLQYCDKPACLAHGNIISVDPIPKGGVVTYTCNLNYKLVGSTTAICMGGYFNRPQPVCLRNFCGTPLPMVNGKPVVDTPRTAVGGVMTYICNPGFRPTGAMVSTCKTGNYWTPMLSICVPITG